MKGIIIVSILLAAVILLALPLVKVFLGKTNKQQTKKRLVLHIGMFFSMVVLLVVLAPTKILSAADPEAKAVTGIAAGLGYLGAALSTGLSALGAGIAVAAAAPAAIGAISENPKNLGKSLIFVALGEGVAIYGLLISILILNNL